MINETKREYRSTSVRLCENIVVTSSVMVYQRIRVWMNLNLCWMWNRLSAIRAHGDNNTNGKYTAEDGSKLFNRPKNVQFGCQVGEGDLFGRSYLM